jgi:hypothetical protein
LGWLEELGEVDLWRLAKQRSGHGLFTAAFERCEQVAKQTVNPRPTTPRRLRSADTQSQQQREQRPGGDEGTRHHRQHQDLRGRQLHHPPPARLAHEAQHVASGDVLLRRQIQIHPLLAAHRSMILNRPDARQLGSPLLLPNRSMSSC